MNDVWQFLSDAATFLAHLWSWVVYGWRLSAAWWETSVVPTYVSLTELRWSDVNGYSALLYTNITGVAAFISSCLTIYGVTLYRRKTNNFLVEKRYDALHQVHSLANGLLAEVNISQNEENIEDARRLLMKSFHSNKYLFDKRLADELHEQWSTINKMTHAYLKLSRANDAAVPMDQEQKSSSTLKQERGALRSQILTFTKILQVHIDPLVKELDSNRRLPNVQS
jgi:hypothetical protein